MKTITTLLLLTLCIGFTSAQESKNETIKSFLNDIITLNAGDLSAYSPITSFNKIAIEKATKSIVITKENINNSINEAKNYKACIITVDSHTIVKITDFNKTIMSGSWGCKMPYGTGYIQKGNLNFKEDYINNIIGKPGSQRRMMYLFN